jgi:hypothetical protein
MIILAPPLWRRGVLVADDEPVAEEEVVAEALLSL